MRGREKGKDSDSGEKNSKVWQYLILGHHRTGVTYSFSVVFSTVHIGHVLPLSLGRERNLTKGRRAGSGRAQAGAPGWEGAPGARAGSCARACEAAPPPQPSGH